MLLVTLSLLEGWEELSWVIDESLPEAIWAAEALESMIKGYTFPGERKVWSHLD